MAAASDISGVLQIRGVKGYYFANYDGTGTGSTGIKVDELLPFISFCGLNADTVRSTLRFDNKFRQIVIARRSREDIVIFPFDRCLLAVMKTPDASTNDLVQAINQFICATQEQI